MRRLFGNLICRFLSQCRARTAKRTSRMGNPTMCKTTILYFTFFLTFLLSPEGISTVQGQLYRRATGEELSLRQQLITGNFQQFRYSTFTDADARLDAERGDPETTPTRSSSTAGAFDSAIGVNNAVRFFSAAASASAAGNSLRASAEAFSQPDAIIGGTSEGEAAATASNTLFLFLPGASIEDLQSGDEEFSMSFRVSGSNSSDRSFPGFNPNRNFNPDFARASGSVRLIGPPFSGGFITMSFFEEGAVEDVISVVAVPELSAINGLGFFRLDYTVSLTANARARNASAQANYGNTLNLAGISFANGDTLSSRGFQVISLSGFLPSNCDLDQNGLCEIEDINFLLAQEGGDATGSLRRMFDMNSDGTLDIDDTERWLLEAGQYAFGDANLDGIVDQTDIDIWSLHQSTNTTRWDEADFNRDGIVDGLDLDIIQANLSVLGDVNLDGVVNFLDISPFINVLSAQAFQAEADIDGNGEVDFFDISPFIALLSGL